jgi:hypothetical protein
LLLDHLQVVCLSLRDFFESLDCRIGVLQFVRDAEGRRAVLDDALSDVVQLALELLL